MLRLVFETSRGRGEQMWRPGTGVRAQVFMDTFTSSGLLSGLKLVHPQCPQWLFKIRLQCVCRTSVTPLCFSTWYCYLMHSLKKKTIKFIKMTNFHNLCMKIVFRFLCYVILLFSMIVVLGTWCRAVATGYNVHSNTCWWNSVLFGCDWCIENSSQETRQPCRKKNLPKSP